MELFVPEVMELFVPEVIKGFHSTDRNIFKRLLDHGFDLSNSKFIVAFWYFLDKKNHFRFMAEKIKPIGDADFRDLAQETLACVIDLIFDCDKSQPSQFRRLSEVVPNLGLVLRNKEEAKRRMEWFMNEVCEKAFGDIIHRYLNGVQEFPSCPPPVVPSLAPKIANTQSSPAKQGITDDEARRSLFVTFSKGHPVSIDELETLIRQQWDGNFEDRVEKIFMDDQYLLSARVLCKSPADVRRIVGDEEGRKVHYSINAKDVRVRKWVRRTVTYWRSQMGRDAPK